MTKELSWKEEKRQPEKKPDTRPLPTRDPDIPRSVRAAGLSDLRQNHPTDGDQTRTPDLMPAAPVRASRCEPVWPGPAGNGQQEREGGPP